MVTGKEKLRERVEVPSEEQAAAALGFLDQRQDPLARCWTRPLEDGEIFPEEATVQEARDELAPGASVISQEEIKREFRIRAGP